MLRTVLRSLSPAGPRARLSVLIFHRVLETPDPLFSGSIDATRFEALCLWLRSWFNVVPLDQAVRQLTLGTLPERALAISFDDGYADNFGVALPILRRHGMPATFFIATGFLDGGRMWNDTLIESIRRTPLASADLGDIPGLGLRSFVLDGIEQKRAAVNAVISAAKYLEPQQRADAASQLAERLKASLPADLMMTSAQVRELSRAGMGIGAHTMTHPILARIDDQQVREEIGASKQLLENLTDGPVTLFAYPNGKPHTDYDERSVRIVRELGFDAAFSTVPGAACAATNRFELPRFTPWDQTRSKFGLRLAANLWRSSTAQVHAAAATA